MGELGQAPQPAESASFLHPKSSLRVLKTGTTTLSRPASSVSASVVISVPSGAGFFAFATITNFSPTFTYPVPFASFSSTTGAADWWLRALYDPSVAPSVLKFFAEAQSGGASFASQQDFRIRYYILAETGT